MPHLNLSLDVHDAKRLHDISRIAYEDNVGKGTVLRRLLYHLDHFQAEILPGLELPPVEGDRKPFCMNIGDGERATLRQLAEVRGWAMNDLLRALIFHHWRLREEYTARLPALRYIDRMDRSIVHSFRMSFQPDRLQPWYHHQTEALARVEAKSKEDQAYLVEKLRAEGMDKEAIEEIVDELEEGREARQAYVWDEDYISPEEIRKQEDASAKETRPVGWNAGGQYWPDENPGRMVALAIVGLLTLACLGGGAAWYFFLR